MEDELKTNAVKLRPEEQYQIRKSIVRLSKLGKKNGEIAEILDVSERHVRSIKNQYAEGGLAAIVPPIKPCQNQAAYFVRACLVSFENNADKSQRKHLERIMQKPFTIFPKSATLIDPTK